MPTYPQLDEISSKRLERVSRFCAVIGTAWLVFGIYYACIGVFFTASVCAVETAVMVVGTYFAFKYPKCRVYVANICLAISMAGIVVETLGSGVRISTTPLFLCCVPLMAAHQTGMRSAFSWMLAVLLLQILIHRVIDPALFPILRVQIPLESLLVQAGVVIVIYAFSQQAEWSFDRYAKQYIDKASELREQTQSLRLAERVARVGHWRSGLQTELVTLSHEAATICGLEIQEDGRYSATKFTDCLVPSSQHKLVSAMENCRKTQNSFELELEFKPGNTTRFARYIGFSEMDQTKKGSIFGVLKDETAANDARSELREQAEALRNMAEFDQLSGLANRRSFRERLEQAAVSCENTQQRFALLLIDFDGFKEINDTMGHAAGDLIIQQAAERLNKFCEGSEHFVARLGGDEFTIILENIESEKQAAEVSESVAWTLAQPYIIDDKTVRLASSIGAAMYPDHTTDLAELLSYADTAMYEAKVQRTGVVTYEASMTEKLVERRSLDIQLRDALKKREFFLVYQPQFSATGELCGVEALLRWRRDGKIVPPNTFIPHLEASHAILDVGRWVLFEACNQGYDWSQQGFDLPVSVNISAVQFRQNDFVKGIDEALQATLFPPHLLDIEITESVVVGEMTSAANTIQRLKDLGVRMSIDDFGTGYSSLSYLRHMNVDRLKIDRAFIKDFPDTDDGTLAKTIVVLAHSLGMRAIAEGVEDDAQVEFLRSCQCDEFQGYAFSKPVSPAEIETLLAEHQLAVAPPRDQVTATDLSLEDAFDEPQIQPATATNRPSVPNKS